MQICEAFGANRYPFPDDLNRQREMGSEVSARTRELQTTIDAGVRHRTGLMQGVAASLDEWTTLVRREKAVYHTLNKMNVDVTSKVGAGLVWGRCGSGVRPCVVRFVRRRLLLLGRGPGAAAGELRLNSDSPG